ncbi:MAG: hypothetical protein ACLTS6_13400 [Anaerobutyricum sp.]
MKAKKYIWSMICVYMAYLTHGMQALIFSQNQVNFATKWGFDMTLNPNLQRTQQVLQPFPQQSHGLDLVNSFLYGLVERFLTVSAVRS